MPSPCEDPFSKIMYTAHQKWPPKLTSGLPMQARVYVCKHPPTHTHHTHMDIWIHKNTCKKLERGILLILFLAFIFVFEPEFSSDTIIYVSYIFDIIKNPSWSNSLGPIFMDAYFRTTENTSQACNMNENKCLNKGVRQ